jgi:hypothetical protein
MCLQVITGAGWSALYLRVRQSAADSFLEATVANTYFVAVTLFGK